MKHSTKDGGKNQFIFGLQIASKEIKLSKPIWYDSLSSICHDLEFMAKAYPEDLDFVVSQRKKENE